MDAHLREIVDRGGRAQSAEAARLLARLESHPDDAEAVALARALVDAYLNDPDLVR
jgi:undecaprenyl pyrophosphate synthase